MRCFQKRTRAECHAELAESARSIGRNGNILSEVVARAEGGGGIGHTLTQTDFVEFAGVGSAHVVEGAGAGGKLKFVEKFVAYLRAEDVLVGETGGADVVAGFEGEEGRVTRR